MHNQTKTFLASIALTGYLLLSLIGLVSFFSHAGHDTPMRDCPYAIGTHSMCSMDVFGHISAWEDLVRAILPSLLLTVVLVGVSFIWQKPIEISLPLFLRKQIERERSPYVILFSTGILHSRVP